MDVPNCATWIELSLRNQCENKRKDEHQRPIEQAFHVRIEVCHAVSNTPRNGEKKTKEYRGSDSGICEPLSKSSSEAVREHLSQNDVVA